VHAHPDVAHVPPEPGWHLVRVPVTTDLNGMEVGLTIHVLNGEREGPTLAAMSGLHGNEWHHLETFRELRHGLDAGGFRGRLLLLPVANQVSFGPLRRHLNDDSDNPDANRAFPVPTVQHTWLGEQIATAVATHLLQHADYLLDFHLGMWGATLGSTIVGTDYGDPAVNAQSRDLSFAFGTPMIYRSRMVGAFPGPRSSQGWAGERLRIPCCGSMLGGAGFDRAEEDAWRDANVRGVRNVLAHLGMLDAPLRLPERYLVYEAVQRVNPRVGGLLVPEQLPDRFGREVTAGERLGRVVSPYTLDTIEELIAPFDGYLAYWARNYPLRPGDWAYCVIPADHPGTAWIDAADLDLETPAAPPRRTEGTPA
jgi:predicted deacylase